jgi:hypothetical protein
MPWPRYSRTVPTRLTRPPSVVVGVVVGVVVALPACFDPTDPPADPSTGTADTGIADTGTATTPGTDPSAATASGSSSDTDPATTDPTATSDATTDATDPTATTEPADTTDGGVTPTICDGAPTDLVACDQAYDGTPSYGTLGCDPAAADYSVFFEDIFTVSLVAGDCLYLRFDNIGEAGATSVNAADLVLEIRSPSGAYGLFDDIVACTDPTWLAGGACPQALVTADVDGVYEIAITQVSGAGCISPAPYTGWAAINGLEYTLPAAPDIDEALVNCSGA